ncbi:DUF2637 domain-containing protein [Streptomyces lavendulae]|uniref:DUF2637 domain-containing protein n=1 Tax=Streptomyces lavendulae TaxID=1914 RepID=UPI0033D13D2F
MTAPLVLTRTHRVLIGVVVGGGVLVATIGFIGSYGAVHQLAVEKGFGGFARVFPIGIDLGIGVLLALDLLLTWLRIPFPVLRHIAWLLTAATITFNGAAAWPDPLGVGMHAVIPVLFVVTVEAARHAIGRLADITADKAMEGVRITRWLLSPIPTFKLWRRMKLWELREYEQAVGMEQDRLIYQARLQAQYGRAWRRKAPVEALLPLRLARIGVPLTDTAPAGLVAAGISTPVASVSPSLEVHAEEAVAGTLERADPPAEEVDVLPELAPPVVPAWVPAYAEAAPRKGRDEVTARLPEEPEPGFEGCEEEEVAQVPEQPPAQEMAPDPEEPVGQFGENGQGAPAGESDDESTNEQATPPGTLPPAPPEPPAEEPLDDAQVRYRVLAEGWVKAVAQDPALTKTAYAAQVGVGRRTLGRALATARGTTP